MASELHVDAIKHSGGTSALTIDSSGNVSIPGAVVQMQSTTTTSTISTSSTSLIASGLTVAITPKFSNSKIIVTLTGGNLNWSGSANDQQIRMYRQLTGGSYADIGLIAWVHQNSSYGLQHASELVDSPSTTNAINYQPYFKTSAGTTFFSNNSVNLVLRVMEIAQ